MLIRLALILFGSLLSSTVSVAVRENVLSNQLLQRLSGISGFNRSLVTEGGAMFLNLVPADLWGMVLAEYNKGLRKVFQIGLTTACLGVLGAATLELRSIEKKPAASVDAEKSVAAKEKKGGETTMEQGGK
jgi:hypothetical protein